MPAGLLIPPAATFALTLTAWFATAFHYQPWGWLVTAFLSGISCLALHHFFYWNAHRQTMLKLLASPSLKRVDCLLLAIGLAFLGLAVFAY